jgi:N-acetylmuramoyl-L-alanine amidase
MKYIFITAGHSAKGQDHGAVTPYGDESKEARIVVDALSKKLATLGVTVETEDDSWNLSKTIAWIASKIVSSQYNIDIHFNSSVNELASGTEILIPDKNNDKEMALGIKVSNVISTVLGIKNRGVKHESESQHSRLGILSNNGLFKANNLLIEVCFISSPYDMRRYRDTFDKLIDQLAKTINDAI